ncbi:MAG: hypothetical protein NW214_10785 [Pseudanabaenaceae cyanobacterium bins.39]|nr:hypothetical protein [Pseudanabaenaceae cyanobacterium bins.39]
MVVVGIISGIAAYSFGKQALEGVNPAPVGVKLPKSSPISKPQEPSNQSPKPSPQSMIDGKAFSLLDESQVIANFKSQAQAELGDLKRPSFVAIAKSSSRNIFSKTFVKIDRTYGTFRDPLAISASADQRIAQRIAELRQRVYTIDRSPSSYTNVSERTTIIGRSIDRHEPTTSFINPDTSSNSRYDLTTNRANSAPMNDLPSMNNINNVDNFPPTEAMPVTSSPNRFLAPTTSKVN